MVKIGPFPFFWSRFLVKHMMFIFIFIFPEFNYFGVPVLQTWSFLPAKK